MGSTFLGPNSHPNPRLFFNGTSVRGQKTLKCSLPKKPEMLVCGFASWVWETRIVVGGEDCTRCQQRALVAWESRLPRSLQYVLLVSSVCHVRISFAFWTLLLMRDTSKRQVLERYDDERAT